MELYSYFRSSAAYRVRIALNLKKIDHQIIPVNLLKGDNKSQEYRQLNSQGLVPSLTTDNGQVLIQSMAILEWLEEQFVDTPLLPSDILARARVRSWCHQIACDIHPLNNLRVLKYLSAELNTTDEQKNTWYKHWVEEGFQALESQLSHGPYCNGAEVTLADVFLVPQVFNALRFKVDMEQFPKIHHIYQACNKLPEFVQAKPENQVDT